MTSRTGELLKALRAQWLTAYELADELGTKPDIARRILRTDLVPHGIVVSRIGKKRRAAGYSPTEYTLAPEWRNE